MRQDSHSLLRSTLSHVVLIWYVGGGWLGMTYYQWRVQGLRVGSGFGWRYYAGQAVSTDADGDYDRTLAIFGGANVRVPGATPPACSPRVCCRRMGNCCIAELQCVRVYSCSRTWFVADLLGAACVRLW